METWEAPRYGAGTLADVVPSLLAGLRVPGEVDVLGLPDVSRVCLLLIDGLGWNLLHEYADDAPFLSSLTTGRAPIGAGFPATTATSIAAIGTGLPAGEHGLVGYSFAMPEGLLNALQWNRHGVEPAEDLRTLLPPEQVQPRRTAWERAVSAGVAVSAVAPYDQERSGLTRAVLRGADFRGVLAFGDLTSGVLHALQRGNRALCYAYHANLDTLGHLYGPGSEPWRLQLAHIDQLAETIADRLPPDGALVITADHGMVLVDERVDYDTEPSLRQGVRLLGGEVRVRHVYTEPGASEDVRQAWQGFLGERAWVVTRAEAIANGWFGPRVADHVLNRIGDVVVALRGTTAVTRSAVEPMLSRFVGHHGSLTRDEQLIPLLVHR